MVCLFFVFFSSGVPLCGCFEGRPKGRHRRGVAAPWPQLHGDAPGRLGRGPLQRAPGGQPGRRVLLAQPGGGGLRDGDPGIWRDMSKRNGAKGGKEGGGGLIGLDGLKKWNRHPLKSFPSNGWLQGKEANIPH